MRPSLRSFTTIAAALVATLVADPAAAMRPTTLDGHLPRGADVSIPHLEGKTVVDGSVRIRVSADRVRLLGKSGSAYVVGTTNSKGGHGRVFRVTADGTRTLLAKAHPYLTVLAGDGATVVTTRFRRTPRSTVSVVDATTGQPVATREFSGYGIALDAQGDRVLVGGRNKTVVWTTGADSVAVVSRDGGYEGDLSSDVLATFTKDPYADGCSELRRLSSGALLWRSCTERVEAFNADATRIATTGILSDGPGPGRVDARTISGKHLGRYQIRTGWIGEIQFETQTALLMEVNGARKAFTARCVDTDCERASRLRPAEQLRAAS